MNDKNFLKLNLNKTQLLVCGKKRLLNIGQTNISNLKNCLQIDSNLLPSAKLLGVFLDESLTLDHMVTETYRIEFFKFFKLRNSHLFLSKNIKFC